MSTRNYSSTAAQTTLASGVDASATTLSVSATTGFPAVPFIIAVDAGAAAQELVLVTNVAGTNLTVTRGYDSTVAVSHDAGAVVSHSHGAIDFREANAHVNASSGVHGASGAIVGANDLTSALTARASATETLTNKNLSGASNTFPWVIKRGSGTLTFSSTPSNSATATVSFGFTFSSPPTVVASVNNGQFMFGVKDVTTTGFTLGANYSEGPAPASFALGYTWIAVL